METVLIVLLTIIAIALIIVCLLQNGKSDGLVNALTGQSSNLFSNTKDRGSELVLTRITVVLAIAFFVLSVVANII